MINVKKEAVSLKQPITMCHEVYPGFEIEHCKRQEPTDMKMYHYHGSYEIYYLCSGIRNYFIKDRTYRVEKGDLVLINKNDLHKTTSGGSLAHERIWISLDDRFISTLIPAVNDIDIFLPFHMGIHIIKLSKTEQSDVERFLFRIMKEAKEKGAGSQTCIKLITLELLIYIARRSVQSGHEVRPHLDQMHERISDIVVYINENYMEKLTLQIISEKFFVSSCYLSRLFKKVTGFSFVEYLNSVRVREAQRLLKETNCKITDIAGRTGYESATHFGRIFKQITGFSPLRFRKINTNA